MDKIKVYEAIQLALLKRFENAKYAAEQAHEAAISKESIAENKYDTFGLEASYLAHGQSQRVIECEQDWLLFSKSGIAGEHNTIGLWNVAKLTSIDFPSNQKCFYISPCAGGLTVECDGLTVFLVTTSSPVGKALLGKFVGDEVSLLQNGQQTVYEIDSIL